MSKQTIFTGAGVAIVTPMHADGSLNFDKLDMLIEQQLAAHTDSIVICGTTGESSAMSDEEHIACVRRAVRAVNGRVPVVAGAGSNHTDYAVWMSKECEKAGADALLHVTPYYNKTSQKGLAAHFDAVVAATALPIILYNVPSRTGLNIAPATYHELAKRDTIVAVKEASGNISQIAETMALCGDALDLYSGNDDQIVPLMALGGKGVISVLSNICPQQTHDICALYLEGKTGESLQIQLSLMDVIKALFSDVNPIPVKEAMNLMGMEAGPCRLPLVPMEDGPREKLTACLKKHGLLG